jgi:hypothetical protein
MNHPRAEVPVASGGEADADEEDVMPTPVGPPLPAAANSANRGGQAAGDPAGAPGQDRARIGNWPDPM